MMFCRCHTRKHFSTTVAETSQEVRPESSLSQSLFVLLGVSVAGGRDGGGGGGLLPVLSGKLLFSTLPPSFKSLLSGIFIPNHFISPFLSLRSKFLVFAYRNPSTNVLGVCN